MLTWRVVIKECFNKVTWAKTIIVNTSIKRLLRRYHDALGKQDDSFLLQLLCKNNSCMGTHEINHCWSFGSWTPTDAAFDAVTLFSSMIQLQLVHYFLNLTFLNYLGKNCHGSSFLTAYSPIQAWPFWTPSPWSLHVSHHKIRCVKDKFGSLFLSSWWLY